MALQARLVFIGLCILVLTTAVGWWLGSASDQEPSQTIRTDIVTGGSPIADPTDEARMLENFLTRRFPGMNVAMTGNRLRISMSRLKPSDIQSAQYSIESALKEFSAMIEKRIESEKNRTMFEFGSHPGNAAVYKYLRVFRDWEWLESVNLTPRLTVDDFIYWNSSMARRSSIGALAGFALGLGINIAISIALRRKPTSA